jgi:glycosyltransferase involved in cell wall biosynthesis
MYYTAGEVRVLKKSSSRIGGRMNFLRASLICTVYNEERTIGDFLESIKHQTQIPDEIVIVDGGSTDRTVQMIRSYVNKLPIKLIVKKCNIAEGRNMTIRNAKHAIIAVTDAGATLDPEWFENITRPFENPGVDVVSGYYIPLVTTIFEKCAARFSYRKPEQINSDNFLPSSRSLAFKKEIWHIVGGYPEHLRLAEDTYFDLAMKKAGARFHFEPKAMVYWQQGSSLKEFMKKRYTYALWDGIAGIVTGKMKLMLRAIATALLIVMSIVIRSVWPLLLLGLGIGFLGFLDREKVTDLRLEDEHPNLILELSLMVILRVINDTVSLTGFINGSIRRIGRRFVALFQEKSGDRRSR